MIIFIEMEMIHRLFNAAKALFIKFKISSRLAHCKEREPNFDSEKINTFKATIQSVIENARKITSQS